MNILLWAGIGHHISLVLCLVAYIALFSLLHILLLMTHEDERLKLGRASGHS